MVDQWHSRAADRAIQEIPALETQSGRLSKPPTMTAFNFGGWAWQELPLSTEAVLHSLHPLLKLKRGHYPAIRHKPDPAALLRAHRSGRQARVRGIYQCVKYQALLRAELKAEGKIPNGSSLLITETQLSPTLQALANLLGIRVVLVPAKGPQRPNKK
jgi:hypothetical protein